MQKRYIRNHYNRVDRKMELDNKLGRCYTPHSTDNKVVIEFSGNSFYREYTNDTLTYDSKYHIIVSKSIYSLYRTGLIVYDKDLTRQSYYISHDTLFLNDECDDGYSNSFKRIK